MRSYNNDDELCHWGILGMKWGKRRYQNKDGTLTEAGKKRYTKDVVSNERKKKDKRIPLDENNPDIDRWVDEDIQRTKSVMDDSNKVVGDLKRIEKNTYDRSRVRMDLTNMTNKELQEAINRESLELRYNDLFAQPKVSKGREVCREVLDVAGDLIPLASSSLALALSIRTLRRGL